MRRHIHRRNWCPFRHAVLQPRRVRGQATIDVPGKIGDGFTVRGDVPIEALQSNEGAGRTK